MKIIPSILCTVLIVLSAGLVSADFVIDEAVCSEQTIQDCEVIADIGVQVGAGAPAVIPSNAIINMYLMDESVIGYVSVEEGVITETICCREHENQTHVAKTTSADVITQIHEAEDSLSKADEMLKAGEISFQAEKFTDKARLAVAKAFLRVRSWFN